jgi:hypothetical protein
MQYFGLPVELYRIIRNKRNSLVVPNSSKNNLEH